VSLVEQELLTLPEHLTPPPVFSEVRVTRSLVLYVCFVDRCLSFCTFFLLTIVLSVLLRYTDSDYPFGIFKLFFQIGIFGVYVCFNTLLVKICRLTNLDRRQYIFKGLIILFC